MGAQIEVTTGVIRAGCDFNQYGDPYEFSATVIFDGEEARIIGASGKFTMQMYYDIKIQLLNLGVKRVNWERLKNNKQVSFNLRKGDK
jgi:hypothetical protein